MNLPRAFKDLNYKRKNLLSVCKSFLKKLPLYGNKKSRMQICNRDHWTRPYFKVKGTVTVSETVYFVLEHVYSSYFETRTLFNLFVSHLGQTIEYSLFGALFLVLFVAADNERLDRELGRKKNRNQSTQ